MRNSIKSLQDDFRQRKISVDKLQVWHLTRDIDSGVVLRKYDYEPWKKIKKLEILEICKKMHDHLDE